jgi:hypothetical protein
VPAVQRVAWEDDESIEPAWASTNALKQHFVGVTHIKLR